MPYQLVKELSPDCLEFQNEAGEKFIFDKIPFVIPPKENLRKEIQKEIREIVEEERTIKTSGLIKYIDIEKYQNEFYLIRENSREFSFQQFETGAIEEACHALLLVLKALQVYHQHQKVVGGVSPATVKRSGKNFYLLDPLIYNYLNKSLEEGYQIERAPEVIAGNSWSAESDIFSWGVLAYRLLSGKDPFQAATPEERVAKILRTSVIHLKDVKPEVNYLLSQMVMGCLHKNPQKRPKIENLIPQLTKMLEDKSYALSEVEARKYRERAEVNQVMFKIKEAIWLWSRKYGKIVLISLGVLFLLSYLIWGSKPKPLITASAKPIDVMNYYFQGIKEINVSLIDEAVHKAKNSLSNMIATLHVLNATRKSVGELNENLIRVDIERLDLKELLETPEEARFRAEYTLKIIMPKVSEYLERIDDYTLKPVRKVWRITDIQILKQKQWKVEAAPTGKTE